jgi:hypothetical protein
VARSLVPQHTLLHPPALVDFQDQTQGHFLRISHEDIFARTPAHSLARSAVDGQDIVQRVSLTILAMLCWILHEDCCSWHW